MSEKFDEVLNVFGSRLRNILKDIPVSVKEETYEIRVRADRPVVLTGSYGVAFVDEYSAVSHMKWSDACIVSSDEFSCIVSAVCGYSVYSHQSDILSGYVTFGNGHRAGFCGTAVLRDDEIIAVNNLTSINIRIARVIDNAGREIADRLFRDKIPKGLIVAGKPCSGKTTVLRSLSKLLSSDYCYGFRKCAVIDERSELGVTDAVNCDFLIGYPKETGIVHALRTLSPEIIICDEISTEKEAEKIISGTASGVSFIISLHASDRDELMKRRIFSVLIESGAFDYTVILGDASANGRIREILKTEDLSVENNCSCVDFRKHDNACFCDPILCK